MSLEQELKANTAALVALTARLLALEAAATQTPAQGPAPVAPPAPSKPAETKAKDTPPPAAAPDIPAEITYASLADKVTAAIKTHTKATVLEALKTQLPNGKLADVKDTPAAWPLIAEILAELK